MSVAAISRPNALWVIERAKKEDADQIVHVAQEAYFHKKIIPLTSRDISQKKNYAVEDVPRRIKDAETYKVFVCKDGIGIHARVIGTVYYQSRKTNFLDAETNKELAEIGLLAVHPDFWKKGVSDCLVKKVLDFARADKMRGIYLYAIASRNEKTGEYSNSLPGYYEKFGFKFVFNRESSPSEWYTTANKRIKQVVMVCDFSKKFQAKMHGIIEVSTNSLKPIPDQAKAKEDAASCCIQ